MRPCILYLCGNGLRGEVVRAPVCPVSVWEWVAWGGGACARAPLIYRYGNGFIACMEHCSLPAPAPAFIAQAFQSKVVHAPMGAHHAI